PYTTLFRSERGDLQAQDARQRRVEQDEGELPCVEGVEAALRRQAALQPPWEAGQVRCAGDQPGGLAGVGEVGADHGLEAADVAADRKSTRLLRIPEARAEVLAEAVVRFDDARLH